MSRHSIPILPFTVVFILGILLHDLMGTGWWLPALTFLVVITLFLLRRHYVGLLACGVLTGYALAAIHVPAPLPATVRDVELPYAGVTLEVKELEPAQIMVVRVDSCLGKSCPHFLVKLTVPSSLPAVGERDRIAFTAALSPAVFDPDLPGETDFDRPLRLMGVVGQALVRPDSLRVCGPEPGVLNSIRRFRTDVMLTIVDLPLSDGCKEFLDATIPGARSMLTPDMRELFSTTGLSHLLALSGLHVAIIAGVVAVLLFPLSLSRRMSLVRGLAVVVILWLFAIMTGLGPSVVRSVLMATLFFISFSLQRQRSPFNSLCVAALIILVFNPASLYSVGFQLSFLAVGAILLFAEVFNPVPRRKRVLHSLFAYPAVTLAAMLGTAIVSAYYFNVFPLFFLPSNFIAALIVPFVLSGGVLLVLLGLIGIHSPPLAVMVNGLFDLLTHSASWFASFRWASVTEINVPVITLAAWFVTLIPFIMWIHRRRTAYLTAALLCLVFTFSTAVFADAPDLTTEVYIPREQNRTSIIVRDGHALHIITSAPERSHAELREDYRRKYRKYLLSRDIDTLHILTAARTAIEPLRVGDHRYALIHNASQLEDCDSILQIDYALVCAGFRGDITELTNNLAIDTILLSADLNNRRHDRYLDELSAAGHNVRSLKRSPFVKRTESAL